MKKRLVKKILSKSLFPCISVYPAISLSRFSSLFFFADTRSWSLEFQQTQRMEEEEGEGEGRR